MLYTVLVWKPFIASCFPDTAFTLFALFLEAYCTPQVSQSVFIVFVTTITSISMTFNKINYICLTYKGFFFFPNLAWKLMNFSKDVVWFMTGHNLSSIQLPVLSYSIRAFYSSTGFGILEENINRVNSCQEKDKYEE